MKILITVFAIFFTCINFSYSQTQQKEIKYSSAQLHEDFSYLKHLITDVHVNPNWILSPQQYDQLFDRIETTLKDSSSATNFLKKIKPVIAYLSDEHSQIYLKPILQSQAFQHEAIYIPFSISKIGNSFSIKDLLKENTHLTKGERIVAINNVSIETCVQRCALDTIGFPNQRLAIALKCFGYLYPWTSAKETTAFAIKTGTGKTITITGTTLKAWNDYLRNHAEGKSSDCEERLTYNKYGNTGYINACSFDVKSKGVYSLDSIKSKIDRIFKQISLDKIEKLIVDVSQNGGGNSAVGEYIISNFYDKPYKDYQMNFKKSDEYLKLYESWGFHNVEYKAAVGSVK